VLGQVADLIDVLLPGSTAAAGVWCNLGTVALVDCTVAPRWSEQNSVKSFIVKESLKRIPKLERQARGFRFMKKVAIEVSRVQNA